MSRKTNKSTKKISFKPYIIGSIMLFCMFVVMLIFITLYPGGFKHNLIAASKDIKISKNEIIAYLPQLSQQKNIEIKYSDLSNEDLRLISEQVYLDKKLQILAKNSGIHRDKKVQAAMISAEKAILKEVYLNRYLEDRVTELKLRKSYQQLRDENKGKKKYKISHIFLADTENLDFILSELEQDNFAEMAEQYSQDDLSKEQGGEIGYVAEDLLALEIKQEVENLEIGEISEPIKTEKGYQIIYIEDIQDIIIPEYAEIAQQLKQNLSAEILADYYQKIIEQAELKLLVKNK